MPFRSSAGVAVLLSFGSHPASFFRKPTSGMGKMMKKILRTMMAATMFAAFTMPAFAAINPTTINESSSSENIYKIIQKKIDKGETSGVTGAFAWAYVNGEVISLNTVELKRQGSRDAAVKYFKNYIQDHIGSSLELSLTDLQEAQSLFDTIREAQPELNIEVVKALVEAQFPDVVFLSLIHI